METGVPYERELDISGTKNYCLVELTDGIVVGVSATYGKLYENVPNNMMLILFSLCVLSFVTVFLIVKMLDKFILSDIYGTIEGTKTVSYTHLNRDPVFV